MPASRKVDERNSRILEGRKCAERVPVAGSGSAGELSLDASSSNGSASASGRWRSSFDALTSARAGTPLAAAFKFPRACAANPLAQRAA